MHNRFAVIKLWEDTVSAEDENIARIIAAAHEIGVECVPVDRNYKILPGKTSTATEESFDFVLHLHFDSLKINNLFSFVTLWNPLEFYHEWEYRRFSDALRTHDDFLSCASQGADRHIKRLIVNDNYHLEPMFTMFHSLSSPILMPDKGKGKKLFYCGINWERLGRPMGRHAHLLKFLDKLEKINIYGPEQLSGIKVWSDFKCYRGEVPFDGKSMIHKIHESGISLVLSSKAHIESSLMSNRLFESLAAGVNIICDQNPFPRKYFGDLLFYIDTKSNPEEITHQVMEHFRWIEEHPSESYEKAVESQKIFLEKFNLKDSLVNIYKHFHDRKRQLESLSEIDNEFTLTIFHFVYSNDKQSLNRTLENITSHQSKNFHHIVYTHGNIANSELITNIKIISRQDANLGNWFTDSLKYIPGNSYFTYIFDTEKAFSHHYHKIMKVMLESKADCGYSHIIYGPDDDSPRIPMQLNNIAEIISTGNFIFHSSVLSEAVKLTLQDLEKFHIGLLYRASKTKVCSNQFSIITTKRDYSHINNRDINVISDIFPEMLRFINHPQPSRKRIIIDKLRKLKKFPQIWRLLKFIQIHIFRRKA